ncbi:MULTISPECIES: protein translocase subunit SecD [Dehalococcoides]|jgi:preprotein translocase subunit SecD|uniref:Protein translocase subunit SecD n=3 Tax=Dehalococcoides mccartyi TaxID=61435 RepID=A0A142V8G1_9CHLR|nr:MULTISPECIES: protein translocase subunit SecD [Dehalococcoides]CAI82507.1 protein-export membrane protein SecD [Dehalococcoides mccartyi CBDB1]AGG05977.1 preprotein translocase subunit SecD [Dehalococcoides mccartyi DCMB5]AII60448.1 preprotein translocase subunit SecD [Dehalococcoides mccartyi CG5]AMU86110.1 preprotein translocuse subunit SecD [Dehalococcoides mccartyi]AQX74169.1 protein translocase subunit SecD [Dehalococcoides mccartyi]
MRRKNGLVFLAILAAMILAFTIVLPTDKGTLLGKGILFGLDLKGGLHMVYQADLSNVDESDIDGVMDGVVEVISNRINPLGVTEALIQRQGDDRIVVELPGLDITDEQKARIGRTALLEFGELAADGEDYKWENSLGKWKPVTATIDGVEYALTSAYFKDSTYVNRDQYGNILLVFEWDATGAKLSKEITTRLLNQQLGIFEGDEALSGDDGVPIAPVINNVIETSGVIEGLSYNEADMLSNQLNAGRLPVPLESIYEQTVSPTLGQNFVDLAVKAGLVGIILVMIFMIAFYRLPGLLASIALVFYGVIVMALFKLVPVTLTLAGIGGFIVSAGMAVDANILIFARLKEELLSGKTLGAAVEAGFSRAWSAIWDSNVTTFIACGILFWVGGTIAAGAPVKGFAVTLFLGVAVSMFTAIFVTRTLLRLFVGTKTGKKLALFTTQTRGKNE